MNAIKNTTVSEGNTANTIGQVHWPKGYFIHHPTLLSTVVKFDTTTLKYSVNSEKDDTTPTTGAGVSQPTTTTTEKEPDQCRGASFSESRCLVWCPMYSHDDEDYASRPVSVVNGVTGVELKAPTFRDTRPIEIPMFSQAALQIVHAKLTECHNAALQQSARTTLQREYSLAKAILAKFENF